MDIKYNTEKQIEKVMQLIANAAKSNDLSKVTEHSHHASKLESILIRAEKLEQELLELSEPVMNNSRVSNDPKKLKIRVSQGMINQNLLTLTQYVKRGVVKSGTEFNIESMPSGEVFKTKLLSHSNKLQERGAISRFYKDASVRAGDDVILSENRPGKWVLRKALRAD